VTRSLLVMVFFSMPFKSSFSSAVVFFWCLFSFFSLFAKKEKPVQETLRSVFSFLNIEFALILIWFIVFFSALGFSDQSLVQGKLETKLAFILVPILFVFNRINALWTKRIFLAFLIGNVLAFFYNLTQSTMDYAEFGNVNTFVMRYFSELIHPSYWGMYLVFCIVLIGVFWKNKLFNSSRIKWIILIFGFICLAGIALSQSKNAILFMLLIGVFYLLWWIRKGGLFKGAIILASFFALLVVAFFVIPNMQARFGEVADSFSEREIPLDTKSSTDLRMIAWGAAIELIEERPIMGHGLGQEKKNLVEVYKRNGYSYAADERLDAHNQFLSAWISTGIFGLLSILYAFFILFYKGIKERNELLLVFTSLVFFSCLTESMFESQSGILFFVFFALLLSHTSIGRKQVA